MGGLVCYSCGAGYYSAASIERLKGPLTCDAEANGKVCGAPLFDRLDPPTLAPAEALELRPGPD